MQINDKKIKFFLYLSRGLNESRKRFHRPNRYFSFFRSSSKPDDYTTSSRDDEKALVRRSDGRLAVSKDHEKIFEHDDKFSLSKIQDIKKIFTLLKQANYNYPLNDLIYFLRRIVELNDRNMIKIDSQNTPELSNFFRKIKENLREATQDYPLIGSYAYCFWKLNYKSDEELWLILGDHIVDDRFYPNFKETVYALEGFTMLKGFANKEFIDQIYQKLERLVLLTLWEVNMVYYKRIVESLVKVDKYNPIVFERIENHVMNNLAMEYELNTILDILFAFARSGNGSQKFYNAMQFIIFKGHMYNRPWPLSTLVETPWHGNFIGKLCEVYDRAKIKYPDMILEADFRAFVYKLIINKKANYYLEDLVQVLRHIDAFEFEDINEINEILDKRLFEIEENMHADDMIKYLDIKAHRDHDGDYLKLPKKILIFFDNYLKKNLAYQDPHKLYIYINDIEMRGLLYEKREFVNQMVEYVANHLGNYDFEETCYYYWLFNKYNFLIDMEDKNVNTQMNMIKDHIRLGSAFSKGKLSIGSNFYKMLEVVSGSDFLSQGEYPDW